MENNTKGFWNNLKEKNNRFRSKHFDLSEEAKFRFDILNYKTDGMIFVTTVLIVPFILALMIWLINPDYKEGFQILYIVSVCIGLIFSCIRNNAGIFKEGYLWIYLFILGPQLASVIVSIFVSIFVKITEENKEAINSFASIITMFITEITIIALVLKYDRKIPKRIKETFKKNWKEVIFISLIGVVLLFVFVNLIITNLIETKLFGFEGSNNQESLNGSGILDGDFGNGAKIAYIILLFLFSIITAPLCEEICMRNSFNLNASNKLLGFVSSAMFFGFVHYGTTFDFGHILSYSAAGFVLSGVFLYTKGNMTYSWTIHILNNLIAFILMLAI
ncbi:CPBP family intramembrane glutamic endopeptidase [Spiroplasma sp. BIUS-1]|uniref:CPBP family intramembrane glutamic endopeptidase n=1 Tax=Spiroplasma sp. BIUS-1 TaxID=216964 RepID=UPI001399680F|nr:CPBP family intramembrane glutamic endopeptidase [Spiroplasma sp. BIUS-1]QHX36360.1 CAAX amino terminal membrane bound protease [Spiroplasma sp. BIUS-1]